MSNFGDANYEKSSFKKKNHFNLEESIQVFGIMPPMFSLKEKGVWARFYRVHFGYKNLAGKLRTFLSPEVKKKEMIEVEDAALQRIKTLTAKMEECKANKQEDRYNFLWKLVGFMGVYNLDKAWHLNVHDLSGKPGVLKIRHKCKMMLDTEIEKLRKQGIDPLSPINGRYFAMQRVGTGNETSYKVDVYSKEIDAQIPGTNQVIKAKQEVVRVISPETEANAVAGECGDLDKLFQVLTADEVKQVVERSELETGKSPACDEFFDARWKVEREARKNAAPAATTTTAAAAPAAAASKAPATPDEDEPGEAYSAPSAAAPTSVAAAAAPTTVAQATVTQEAKAAVAQAAAAPAASTFETMSDDDFFASVGVKRHA